MGDSLIIRNEEIIPADAFLESGNAHIDYSFVTGESKPTSIGVGNKIYAGGRQKGQKIRVKIEKEVNNSYLTSPWNQEAFKKTEESGYKNFVDTISRFFTFSIVIIALVALIYWWFIDTSIAINVFTAVLIVACPCCFGFNNSIHIWKRHTDSWKDRTLSKVSRHH